MNNDLISRQATHLALVEKGQASKRYKLGETWELNGKEIREVLNALPSIQPDIIRCKDCEYLCNEDGLRGMCWHINGFGTDVKDKYNSFCSWAKRRE